MYKKLLYICAFLISFGGCSTQEVQTHKDQGPQLQFMMRELNTVVGNNQQSELERDDERRRYALTLVDSIQKFTLKAHDKNITSKTKYINEQNKELFTKHLDEIEKKATEIEDLAKSYQLSDLDQEIVELEAICISCHKDLGVKHVQNLF